uniref:Peptidase A2 domain-containing protein n=1 Tax=Octopus bimaculoides TaxID=37653 RepID=A0A0L8G9Y1_OCTBM
MVRRIEEEEHHFLGYVSSENINAVCEDNKIEWQAKIEVTTKVCSTIVEFRLDTGEDVIVVPNWFFRKNSPIIKPTNKRLYGLGQHKIKVLGRVDATLSYGKAMLQQELYVVQDLAEPLLGGPAIKGLNLLSKINAIKSEAVQYKKDFSSVFTGLWKLRHVYKIHLDETAQPFSIAVPRQLPLSMKKKVQQELK